ncbi:unnamed protein product [Ambrosiozyma monospora]|uniref:Unnamed protein product n=1 Tax=Ambrosiozyma monospora TaxID=43982 RepID=A0A9W7DFP2_AMBMO|nr:unnamed protein product [Ambrosiozyma monospora]
MPAMISDGFNHFMIWFGEPGKLAKHPSFNCDPWKVLHNEPSESVSIVTTEESIKNKETGIASSIEVNRKATGKGDPISERGKKGKKRPPPLIESREIMFTYIKMTNTDEGFTVKKKLLALLYDELHDHTIYRKATALGAKAENVNEEGLATEKKQESRFSKAKRIFNLILANHHEHSEMSKRNYYSAVDNLDVCIEPSLKVSLNMDVLQTNDGSSTLVLKIRLHLMQ